MFAYKKFDFKSIDRSKFLDSELTKGVEQRLDKKKKLKFLPCSMKEDSMQDAKYAKSNYKLILFGILEDGRKATVVLNDIQPYFEVEIPNDENIKTGTDDNNQPIYVSRTKYISDLCRILDIGEDGKNPEKKPVKTTISQAKPFKGFIEGTNTYYKFSYSKLPHRKAGIKLLKELGYYNLISADNCFYRVICRDLLITLCSWSWLKKYSQLETDRIDGLVLSINVKNYSPLSDSELTPELLQEKTVIMSWDIETYAPTGEVPLPEENDHRMCCIGISFQRTYEKDAFLKVVLCDMPAEADNEFTTIVCSGEAELIKAFGDVFNAIKPEFITGFNDSDYDWPWLVNRAHNHNVLLYLAEKMRGIKPWDFGYEQILAEKMRVIKRSGLENDEKAIKKAIEEAKEEYEQEKVDGILKFEYQSIPVKINANTTHLSKTLSFPGYMNVDCRTTFRQLYPNDEKNSLSHFLTKLKLDNKEDMGYTRMHNIYKDFRELASNDKITAKKYQFVIDKNDLDLVKEYKRLKKENRLVNKYCLVDAQRCHDLLMKKNVIMDRREISNLSYCSLYDAFYRANGVKVRNLTIAEGQKPHFNIKINTSADERTQNGKFTGAIVLNPKRGFNISKLSLLERIKKAKLTKDTKFKCYQEWLEVGQLDYYYCIIEEYGSYVSEAILLEIKKKYFSNTSDTSNTAETNEGFFRFLREPNKRPITGLDFSSLYPSLIMAYNFSPEKCIFNKNKAKEYMARTGCKLTKVDFNFGPQRIRSWFVWHDNKTDLKLDDDGNTTEEFKFGVYPYVLKQLFDKRKEIKSKRKVFGDRKEKFEAEGSDYIKEHQSEYDTICFNYNYLDSKQGALKVFMNTFYGEAGNQISPFFLIQVAGGVTSYGQKNIKMAKKFVEDAGCTVHYGDTDSIYLSLNDKYFEEYDTKYYTNKITKLEYWTNLVDATLTNIKQLNADVNNMFISDNGTAFLRMAYEEVLFPVIFTAKKKYFGIPHEQIINFFPQHLFIKGLEVIKRGVSGVLKIIFNQIMWDCVHVDNLYTLVELVKIKVDDIYTRKWDVSDFVMAKTYNPKKKNVAVQTFVKRMKERGIEVPPNERFKCIIVKKYPYRYDYRGRNDKELSVGDKMELIDTVINENLEIDLDYYMIKSVKNQFGRLITYHSDFQYEPADSSEESLAISESQIFNAACNYVDQYASQYYAKYNKFNTVNKQIYNEADSRLSRSIKCIDPTAYKLISGNFSSNGNDNESNLFDWIIKKVKSESKKKCRNYGKKFITKYIDARKPLLDKSVKKKKLYMILNHIYFDKKSGLQKTRNKSYEYTYGFLVKQLEVNMSKYINLFIRYQNIINSVSLELHNSDKISKLKEPSYNDKLVELKFDDIFSKSDTKVLDDKIVKFSNTLKGDKEFIKGMKDLKLLYVNMLSVQIYHDRTKSIVDYLKDIKNKSYGVVERPDKTIKENLSKLEYKKELKELDLKIM